MTLDLKHLNYTRKNFVTLVLINIQRYVKIVEKLFYILWLLASFNRVIHREHSGCDRILKLLHPIAAEIGTHAYAEWSRASRRWSSKTRDIHRSERVRRILTARIPLSLPSIEVQRHCPRCVIPKTTFNNMSSADLKERVSRNMATARGSLAGKDL